MEQAITELEINGKKYVLKDQISKKAQDMNPDATQDDFAAISKSIHEHATREKAIQTIGEYALALQVLAEMLAEKDAAISELTRERDLLANECRREHKIRIDFRAWLVKESEAVGIDYVINKLDQLTLDSHEEEPSHADP